MRCIGCQWGVVIACKHQHVTLRNMVNAVTDGFKYLKSVLEKGVTVFQRTPGMLINTNDIVDPG